MAGHNNNTPVELEVSGCSQCPGALDDLLSPFIDDLEAACDSSLSLSTSLLQKNIQKCLTLLDDCPFHDDSTLLPMLFQSKRFNDCLDKIILHSFIQEFTKRDYFSYDKNDFDGHCEVTECVLRFFIKLLLIVNSLCKDQNSKGTQSSDAPLVRSIEDERNTLTLNSVCQKLTKHLPNLLLVVGANAGDNLWSSQNGQKLSLQLVHILLNLYECAGISDIFYIPIHGDTVTAESSCKRLFSILLHKFEAPLSKERWERNPYLCESFMWFVSQLTECQTSQCISQIMAVALTHLHNFETSSKLKGLRLLNELIEKVTNEELRWFNRAEVIYEALTGQIYSKEMLVLDTVIACLFSVLKVIEKSPDSKRHRFIISTLLTNAEGENQLNLRRVYILRLSQFVLIYNSMCIGHLGLIIRVIENYLEVDDGSAELARFSALNVLLNVLKAAWPRIVFHSETILKLLLKFVVNINSSSHVQLKGENVRQKLEDKVIECLNLLSTLNPSVKVSLEALRGSAHQGYLDNLLKAFHERVDVKV